MNTIQIEVQGKGAIEATETLVAIPELVGSWNPVEGSYKEPIIVTIATIVTIVGGTLAAAEQIRKWYDTYAKEQLDKKIEKVLIVGRNGQRLLLVNATVEQIRQILEG